MNIGKSVVIKGELNGSEDLTIEGQVEGTIQLRDHVLTIGPNGKIKAQVFAKAPELKSEVVGVAFTGWPLITVKAEATFLCVTGIPAYAGTDVALVTPGTNSTGTPAAASSRHSSPPRPKTKGSPPLRRTTFLFSRE